jgi:hypothetical protein
MLAILHLLEQPGKRLGCKKQEQQPFARINHPTSVTTTGSAPPDQTLWPSIIAIPIPRLMMA